jgi:hypothetical protein
MLGEAETLSSVTPGESCPAAIRQRMPDARQRLGAREAFALRSILGCAHISNQPRHNASSISIRGRRHGIERGAARSRQPFDRPDHARVADFDCHQQLCASKADSDWLLLTVHEAAYGAQRKSGAGPRQNNPDFAGASSGTSSLS